MVRAEQTDGRQPMTWSSVDWTATEAVVGRIQDRIFRAAKIKRPRLEPDDEQSSCPVLRGLGSGNGARLPDVPTWSCTGPQHGTERRLNALSGPTSGTTRPTSGSNACAPSKRSITL